MKSRISHSLLSTLGRNELPWRPLRRLGDDSLKGFNIPYPGMDKVVQLATQWIENYRSEQFVRDKALKITRKMKIKNTRTGHADMRNFDAIAQAIHDFIVREIVYVRDQAGVERLQTPDATLRLKSGDCDDMVILSGALLESVGVPTRIKLIGEKSGSYSHIYVEYLANNQWKSFDPTLALYPGYVFPKGKIKADKTVPIQRPPKNLSGFALNDYADSAFSIAEPNYEYKKTGNTMKSGFVTDYSPGFSDGDVDFEKVAEIGEKAADIFSKLKLGGGGSAKKNLIASAKKKDIQNKLKKMGYPQFSNMQGWKGNEPRKAQAMQTIYDAIQRNRSAASTIIGWLEGGQVTPGTISKIKNANFSKTDLPAAPPARGSAAFSPSKTVLIGGSTLLLAGFGFMALKRKKSKK